MKRAEILLTGLLGYLATGGVSGQVVITEFLLLNESGLKDVSGNCRPWIEFLNTSEKPVRLSQFHLSDDPDDVTKWPLPDMALKPGEPTVVLASGGSEPGNAGIRLPEDLDFLALADADGKIVDAFKAIPSQEADISYGRAVQLDQQATTILEEETRCKVHVPNKDLGLRWIQADFDEGNWTTAMTGIGFERQSGYKPFFGVSGDLLEVMSGRQATAYLRIPFDAETARLTGAALFLQMRYDDGFIAYLNGKRIASANAPERPRYNSSAPVDNPDTRAVNFESFDISQHADTLKDGENLLAVHGLNGGSTSSDFLIQPRLVAVISGKPRLGEMGYFETPSPGEPNPTPYQGFLDKISVSQKRGFFDKSFTLTLTYDEEGAEIRYTTNGDEPSEATGTLYREPITISRTTILRAAAVKPGFKSQVSTYSYFFLNDVIGQSPRGQAPEGWPRRPVNRQIFDYGMDPNVVGKLHANEEVIESLKSIPTVSISLPMESLVGPERGIYVNAHGHGKEWERASSMEMLYPDEPTRDFQVNAGLRIRGGYTRNPHFYKHGFRLFFRRIYGKGTLDQPVFGAEGADRFENLDFRTAANHSWARRAARDSDPTKNTFVRDVFARDAQGRMGQPYTRSRYYHLYLNGQYWGVYQSQERPKGGYGEAYLGGDKDEYDAVKTSNRVGGYATEATDGTMDAWNQLWNHAVSMRTDPSNETYFAMQGRNAQGVRDPSLPVLLDPENLIDYMLIIFFMGDGDAPLSGFLGFNRANNWHSLYHREGDQGFQFFCHDGEHTMDVPTAIHDRTGPFVSRQNQPYSNPEWIHQNLVGNEEYRMLMADRIHEHFFNDGLLTPAQTIARFKRRAAEVGPAMIAQSARWGDAQRGLFTSKHWESAVANVVERFLPKRTSIVIEQLKDDGLYPEVAAPTIDVEKGGAQVTLEGKRGTTLYYTTDGSDPRQIGGSVRADLSQSGNAADLKLTQSTTLLARSRTANGAWSALVKRRVLFNAEPASAANLRITEVMYRPAKPTQEESEAGHDERKAFEFIELQSIGSQIVDLAGAAFTNGVYFDFSEKHVIPPGQRVVLVKELAAFEKRYGKDIPVLGRFRGSLSNDGESLGFRAADLTEIESFVYNDRVPWPEEADGAGYSLERPNPRDPDVSANGWQKSSRKGGSPGR